MLQTKNKKGSFYIGDSKKDVDAAKAAWISSIACTYGYITDDTEIKNLLSKIEKLEEELKIKPKEVTIKVEDKTQINTLQNEIKTLKDKVEEYEDVLNHFRRFSGSKATHLKSSRLDDNLYKD